MQAVPSPSSTVLSVLTVAASATLIAGVVSALSVGNGASHTVSNAAPPATTAPPDLGSIAPGSPTTTTAGSQPAGGASTTAAPTGKGGPSTSTAASGPAPTPPPTVAGPVGDPGQPTAEKAGKYLYDYSASGQGSQSGESGTLTETVQTTSTSGGVTRQSLTDTGSPSVSQNRLVEWRPTGYFEIQRDFNFNGQSAQCTWKPAILELPAPLAVGKQWTISSTCNVVVYGQPVNVKITGTAHVSGKQRVKVGADAVDVWVVPSDTTIVASSPAIGTFTIHSVGTSQVSGRLGLLIDQDSNDTVTSSQGTRSGTTHEALKNIHPS